MEAERTENARGQVWCGQKSSHRKPAGHLNPTSLPCRSLQWRSSPHSTPDTEDRPSYLPWRHFYCKTTCCWLASGRYDIQLSPAWTVNSFSTKHHGHQTVHKVAAWYSEIFGASHRFIQPSRSFSHARTNPVNVRTP